MIQTRTFSVSESSVEPTQALLLAFSRSNSAAIAGGQAEVSARSVFLSSIVRAIAFLRGMLSQYRKPSRLGNRLREKQEMAMQRRALVFGGSMSGLLAGIMLHRRGWDVDIFERVGSELSGRGAGIVAQAGLIARLSALGLDTRDLGVAMTTRKILDRDGRTTATIACPQVLTAWERVYRVLRDAFPPQLYHRGLGLVGFEQSATGVRVQLSDGRTVDADVLVGADGLRSTVRQQC